MNNKADPENPREVPKPQYVSNKPPIFYFYEFLQRRPIFIGTLLGALVGLILASQLGWPTNLAVIAGAIGGTVIAMIIIGICRS